jgi:uncharacterized protein with FMN-binding domain
MNKRNTKPFHAVGKVMLVLKAADIGTDSLEKDVVSETTSSSRSACQESPQDNRNGAQADTP